MVWYREITTNTLLSALVVPLLLLLLPLTLVQATSGNNLTKLFGNTTDSYDTSVNHIREESAKLHNDNVTYGKLVDQDYTLYCINTIFLQGTDNSTLNKMNCDDSVIQDIKEYTFADNQTMLHLAYAYLNARGIH